MITLTIKRKVILPSVPNYIRTEDPEITFSIGDLTDEQLTEIADDWKTSLLNKALLKRMGLPK